MLPDMEWVSNSAAYSIDGKVLKLVDKIYGKHRTICKPSFPSQGVYYFQILLKQTAKSGLSIGCAFLLEGKTEPESERYIRIDTQFGRLISRGTETLLSGDWFPLLSGGVVSILVDINRREINFSVNGKLICGPVSLDLKPDERIEQLHPACSLVYEGDILEIIN